MAFSIGDKIRTSIGLIRVDLRDYDGDNATRSITAQVDIHDQNGLKMEQWKGDLRPHLTAAQLNALANFLDAIRTQAESQLLPSE